MRVCHAAAATASSCDYASGTATPGGGKAASGMCWFDWTGYNDATAQTVAGQEFTVNLGSGYTASFTVTQHPEAGTTDVGVTPEPATSSPNGEPGCPQAPSFAYENAPGLSRLYSNWAGACSAGATAKTANITLSNITVTDPAGKSLTGYTIFSRDAEVTQSVEQEGAPAIRWSSDVPLNVFYSVAYPGNGGCENPPPGAGTPNVGCEATEAGGANLTLAATNAKTISALIKTRAREAVAFGIQTAHLTLAKTVSGREKASDSFNLSGTDAQGTTLTSVGTGTGNSATTEKVTVMPLSGAGGVYTLAEAGGSGTSLSDYTQAWSCNNAEAGSPTALPSGSGTSKTVTPIAGDDVSCLITNSASADLSIVKSASPPTAVPGEKETYTLVAKNNGPNPAADVVVSDPLPSGLMFVSADPGCSFAGGKVTCQAGTMAVGQTKTFTITTKVGSSVAHALENTADIHSPTPDPEPKNNEDTVVVPIEGKADLAITKTAAAKTVKVGGQIMYTLVVKNNGPSDATGVKVKDPTPNGLTLVSAAPSQGSCSTAGGDVTCNLGNLAVGGSAQVLVTATVGQTPGSITNKAEVHGDQEDPEPKNNESTTTIEVPPPPSPPSPTPTPPTFDLEVTKTANVKNPRIGQKMTFTITVKNNGPDAAPNAQMTDTPNTRMKIISVKAQTGKCTAGVPIHCELGTIQPGQTLKIKIVAEPTQVGKNKRNAASVTGEGNDINPKNNIDAFKFTVKKVKLKLTKVASRANVRPGQVFSYLIKVTNPTKGIAKKVNVCDRLPSGLAYVRSSPKGTSRKGELCWKIGTLGPKASRKITLLVKALNATGTKVNHAVVTGAGVAAARAKSPVHIAPAPPKPTPVTG